MASHAKTQSDSKVFDEALAAFENAMNSCIKLQEQVAQTSARVLGEMGSPVDMQARAQTMLKDAMPTARKQMDDAVKTFDQSAKASIELLEKAMSVKPSSSPEEFQQTTREIWESVLSTARTNTNAMVQLNARAIDAWADLARKSAPAEAEKK